jgi:ubiquitin carboxyl-terminal hydrolase L5
VSPLFFPPNSILTHTQGVFTYLIEKLGVKGVQFDELVTLDPAELRQLGDVYGVIFLFKYPTKKEEAPRDGEPDPQAAENIFFAAQTIQNACGTQALLSVLLNKDGEVDIGDELRGFKEFTGMFPPDVGFTRSLWWCKKCCYVRGRIADL